jgi:pimeloyl-ACP methyl ester carboxylesterase
VTLAAHLAPRAGARWAARRFLTPRPAPVREPERAVLANARAGEVIAVGRRIATYTWGHDGPVALLVHGWNGHAGQLTSFVDPLLARGFRVAALDAPGHGASEPGPSHIGEAGAAVTAVAAALGDVEIVVGHSAGATACAIAMSAGVAPARQVYLAAAVRPRAWVEAFGAYVGLSAAAVDAVAREVVARSGAALEALEMRRLAPALAAPALLLHDPADPIAAYDDAAAAAAALPDARLLAAPGLGHYRILRDAEVIAAALDFACATDAPSRRASA